MFERESTKISVMDIPKSFDIFPIGYVHSTLKERSDAPCQGWEGAPNARLEILPAFAQGLDGIKAGEDIWIFTWLHETQRSVLKTYPRDDLRNPMKGVFATRSPDRPNPIGLHRISSIAIMTTRVRSENRLPALARRT